MENQDVPTVRVGKKLKKGHGSFWIPKKAVELLVRVNNSSALQIYTYLIIARHADVSGMFSTIGNSGITRKLGVNSEQYERIIKYLKSLKYDEVTLLYTKEEYQNYAYPINEEIEYENQANVNNPNYLPKKFLLVPPMNKGVGRKGYVQWVLNIFNCKPNERVWFHNDLVEDYDKIRVLKRLLRFKFKDELAKFLLLMYNHNDVAYGGVRPYQNMYVDYKMEKIGDKNCIDIYRASEGQLCESDHFKRVSKEVFGEALTDEALIPLLLKTLEDLGLVYRSVVVLTSYPNDKDAVVLYDLDIKVSKGEQLEAKRSRNAALIDHCVEKAGYEPSSIRGKFYKKYTVVAEENVSPYVAGIFRLKYEVGNSKNSSVKEARASKKERKALIDEWLSLLTGTDIEDSSEAPPMV